MVILAALLMAMVSLSMAACPRANSDYYTGARCGAVLDIASPGILANDNRDPGATLKVVKADEITIDPKYGSIIVRDDGSFTYTAAANMNPSTVIGFYYNITDGKCTTTRHALVKIVVTCKCQVKVPQSPINYCMPVTIDEIRADLIKKGAGCVGCGTTGNIDLSQVNVNEEGCYPYYITGCKGCINGRGEICLVEPCEAEARDIEVCEGQFTLDQIKKMAMDNSTCIGDCDGPDVVVYDVTVDADGFVITGGYYIATCHSACGDVTDRGEIKVWQLCDATAANLYVCPGTGIEAVKEWARENSSCGGCDDVEPEFHIEVDDNGHVTGGWYMVTCTVGPGCTSTATGKIIVEGCTIDAIGTCIIRHDFLPAPTAQDILDEDFVVCSCGEPVIYEITYLGDINPYLQLWHYKAYCQTEHGCRVYGESDFEWGECGQIPCPCQADAPDLTICDNTYTEAQVKAMLAVNASCGNGDCDTNPAIVYDLKVTNGFVSGGSYTVTCDPEGSICPTTTDTGKVNVVDCACDCHPVAPNICACIGHPLTDAQFIAKGAKCVGTNCPLPTINDDNVYYDTTGSYEYTVTCESGCAPAVGHVCVRGLQCSIRTGSYADGSLKNGLETMGTVDASIGAFNKLVVTLDPAASANCGSWTIVDSRLYAGVTPMNDCDPSKFPITSSDKSKFEVTLGNIKDWNCGDPIHVNLYAKMSCGTTEVIACTGDMVVDDYYDMVCDNRENCWHNGVCLES